MVPMIPNTSRTFTVAAAALMIAAASLVALSCSDSTKVSHGPPAAFAIVSGDAQFGVINAALPHPFVVKVTDADTVPIEGLTITWALAGQGALDAPSSVTDHSGQAKATLTLGATAGTSTVIATTTGLSTKLTFNATAAAPGVRDDWVTYGHDGARAGASQASLKGPLTKLWRYTPAAPRGTRPFQYVLNALPTADAIFLQWSAQSVLGGGYTGATDVDRVTTDGHRAWTFDGGYDTNIGQWGSVWGTRFVFQDDGIGYLDINTGSRLWFSGVDRWGETLADTSALYVDREQLRHRARRWIRRHRRHRAQWQYPLRRRRLLGGHHRDQSAAPRRVRALEVRRHAERVRRHEAHEQDQRRCHAGVPHREREHARRARAVGPH